MEIVNQELLQQLKDGKVTIHYEPSYRVKGALKKLTKICKTAFPNDINPTGESNFYRRHYSDYNSWSATIYDDGYEIVSIDDFFKPSEININYEIF